jgi:hypothetical protein
MILDLVILIVGILVCLIVLVKGKKPDTYDAEPEEVPPVAPPPPPLEPSAGSQEGTTVAPSSVCSNCGQQLEPGFMVCPNCGTKV